MNFVLSFSHKDFILKGSSQDWATCKLLDNLVFSAQTKFWNYYILWVKGILSEKKKKEKPIKKNYSIFIFCKHVTFVHNLYFSVRL